MSWISRKYIIWFNPKKVKLLRSFAFGEIQYDDLEISEKGWEVVFDLSFKEILKKGYLKKQK